ncbi:MAG TPA: glycosyltransferase [Cyclobacteriaceae bacterium]|nr:glycosyltransferase [Cyclobacteriaceae bacterium]
METNNKKASVVIASILKPVDDTRMFEKMGATLADNGYQVFIIGQPTDYTPVYTGIEFKATQRVNRVSIGRLLLPLKVLRKIIKLKPEYIIANTHELLIVSLLNRIIFGSKIIYDIRENYYRNIRFAETYPFGFRLFLALWVRLWEKVTSLFVHHFFIAEKAYQRELGFLGKRFTVLENKALLPQGFIAQREVTEFKLLFSGTLAKSTGVFQAIDLAEKLHAINGKVRLTIIGYSALHKVSTEMVRKTVDKPFITILGLHQPVSHKRIMKEIAKANFGIIYYPPSRHTEGSMPTKLYEYLACQLPILTWPRQRFTDFILKHKAGLIIGPDLRELIHEMSTQPFYQQPIPDIYWEGKKMVEAIQNL